MLIRRCAWHRGYRGYPMAFGVASWRGFRLAFTDGMCGRCAVRFRRHWNLPGMPAARAAFGLGGLVRVAVSMVVVAGLLLAVRALDDVRAPTTTTAPPETVLVPAPIDEEPMPSLAVPATPRRPRRAPRVVSAPPVTLPPRPVTPEPAVAAVEAPAPPAVVPETPEVTLTASDSTAMEPVSAPPARRFPTRSTFAALPHAGLTEQTP